MRDLVKMIRLESVRRDNSNKFLGISNTIQVITNNLLNISNKNTIISNKWSKKLEKSRPAALKKRSSRNQPCRVLRLSAYRNKIKL